MATLSDKQLSPLKIRPRLPRIPWVQDPVLRNYLKDLDAALQELYTDLSQRVQGYLLAPAALASFGPADTMVTITLGQPEKDTSYVPLMIPSWNAHLWYSTLTATGFVINASAAPGGSGGEVKWILAR